MNKKQWISLVGFILCTALMIGFISEVFREKGSSFDAYYQEPKNTMDVLFVGSSHVYSGYCPAILWREYGVSAYNVYAWSMQPWTAYYYICEALKSQSPDVVFLDVSSICLGVGVPDTTLIYEQNREQNTKFNAGLTRFLLTVETLTPVSETFDLELYHNRWKDWRSLELVYEPEVPHAFLRNFGALFTQLDYKIFDYSFYTDVMPPGDRQTKYLEKIVSLSEKEGFKLVFVCTPYTTNKEQTFILNWTRQYAQEQGIDYLDFLGAEGEACGFDYQYDMADGDHVNFSGAFKITRYCGEYLRTIGICDRWDNPNAEAITKDANAVYRMFEYTDLFDGEEASAERFAQWLHDNKDYHAVMFYPQEVSDKQLQFVTELRYTQAVENRAVFVESGVVVGSETLDEELGLTFPMAQYFAERVNGKLNIKTPAGAELYSTTTNNLCILLYDDALEQVVRAVEVSEDGTVVSTEFSRRIRDLA